MLIFEPPWIVPMLTVDWPRTGCSAGGERGPQLGAHPVKRVHHFLDRVFTELQPRGVDGFAMRAEEEMRAAFVQMDDVESRRLAGDDEIEFLLLGERLCALLAGLFAAQAGEPNLVAERRRAPSRFSRNAQSIAAIEPLVSLAPRPQSLPSRTSPPKGSIVMPATLTVSVCGAKRRRGLPGRSLGKRATTFGRPGQHFAQLRLGAEPAQMREEILRAALLADLRRPRRAGRIHARDAHQLL